MFNLVPWKKRSGTNVPVKRSPGFGDSPLAEFRDEFDAIWDRFWGQWHRGLDLWEEDHRLGLDARLEDQGDKCLLRAELPGFEPDEIELKVSGNTLSIAAEHKEERKDKHSAVYRHGSYQRHFTVPKGIVKDAVEARYHNGVLEVELPKSEASNVKRIPVSTA